MIESILIGAVIAISAFILMILLVSGVKARKRNKKSTQETEQVTAQQQVVEQQEITAPAFMKVVIAQGESIIVGSEGRIPCGEYTMESCEGEEKFNVRIGRYVKEYENGAKVVLTEKQKVTPVSTSIILR